MELLLEKNELVNMGKRVKGCTIICTQGRCWITQESHGNDYILAPGKVLEVNGNGVLIAMATEDCRIKVVLPGDTINFPWVRKLVPQVLI